MTARLWLSFAYAASAGACTPLMAREPVPALAVEPTLEARAELARGVAALAGAARVTLAEDAFTRSSRLSLERDEPGNDPARPATGRTLGSPLELALATDGERCFLLRGAARYELDLVRCEPAPAEAERRPDSRE